MVSEASKEFDRSSSEKITISLFFSSMKNTHKAKLKMTNNKDVDLNQITFTASSGKESKMALTR